MSETPAVRLAQVRKAFGEGRHAVLALDDVTLEIAHGESVAFVGRSGSGKSTLLHLVAGLDTPSAGELWVNGRPLGALGDDDLTRMRREQVGMVHQFFHLMPTLSARENVALPALLAGANQRETLRRADALLEEVGLGDRHEARPHTLSGGEMQRVAIARALIHEPGVLLADEPTGNLDSRAAEMVLERLQRMAGTRRTTVLLVTHSAEAAATCGRVIELRDGRVVSDRARAPAAAGSTPAGRPGSPP